jgi:four helix bundle protein
MKQNYHELKVWSKAMEFAAEVYHLTQLFPKEELYGLTSQTRRAATNIALNIAEGTGGTSNAEFVRFLEMARRSVLEVVTALEIALRLEYCEQAPFMHLTDDANEITAMLTGLIKRVKANR